MYKKCVNLLSLLFLCLYLLVWWNSRQFISMVVMFALLGILTYIRKLKDEQKHAEVNLSLPSKYMVSAVIFSVTFLSRTVYYLVTKNGIGQVSDFAVILERAADGKYLEGVFYYRMFPHKLIYPMLLRLLRFDNQTEILFFQFICVSVVAVMIFLIGSEIKGMKFGIMAAVLYVAWPVQIIYATVVNEEHIAVLLTVLCVFLLILCGNYFKGQVCFSKKEISELIAFSLLIGCLAGICVFFKDWCVVVLLAAVIVGFLVIVFPKAERKKKLLLVMCFGVIICSRSITKTVIKTVAEHTLGVTVNTENMPCYLYVSLNPEGSGSYNKELYEEYFQFIRDNNFDYKRANKMALESLMERIGEAPIEFLPQLLRNKIVKAYKDDEEAISWAFAAMSEEERRTYNALCETVIIADKVYYLVISSFAIIAVLSLLIGNKDKYEFWFLLVISGGMLLSMIIESQGRYKYCAQPFWCLLAACGLRVYLRGNIVLKPQKHT